MLLLDESQVDTVTFCFAVISKLHCLGCSFRIPTRFWMSIDFAILEIWTKLDLCRLDGPPNLIIDDFIFPDF